MTLSDQSQTKMEARRGLEWKLRLGLWAAILFTARFLLAIPPADRGALTWPIMLLFLAILAFDFIWTWSVQRSHFIDQKFHLHFRGRAESLVGINRPLSEEYPKREDLGYRPALNKQGHWILIFWCPTGAAIDAVAWLVLNTNVHVAG